MSPSDASAMVLTYHSISTGPAPLCVSPQRFAEDLDALAEAGWRALPLGALVELLERGGTFPGRSVALTFDDGYADFADAALPILEQRGLPATLFATASRDRARLPGGTDAPLLPLEALAELPARGVEIGAHSVGHVDLTGLAPDALDRELSDCRRRLEDCAGRAVEHFAYPYGRWDREVRTAVARRFRSACTTELARLRPGVDRHAMPRVDAWYLGSRLLRFLLSGAGLEPYLRLRRALRRARGSEPRPPSSRFRVLPSWGTLPGVGGAAAGEDSACP